MSIMPVNHSIQSASFPKDDFLTQESNNIIVSTENNAEKEDTATRTYESFTKFCAALATGGGVLACFHPLLGLGVVLGVFSIFLLGTVFFLIAKASKEGFKTAGKALLGMIFAPLYLIHSLFSFFSNREKETMLTQEECPSQESPSQESPSQERPSQECPSFLQMSDDESDYSFEAILAETAGTSELPAEIV